MSKTPLFEAKEICKDYPSAGGHVLHVLEKIDLTIYPHEVVAIIGPSGCGKSTLLRIAAGLIPQTTGKIFYHGKEFTGLLPKMSMVFQSFALYPWMTVRQNIEIVLKAAHATVEEMKKKTSEAIQLIGLTGFEEAYPREISGGMKQRVGIARALVRNPELLFMDEPFSEVDAFTAEVLRAEVIKIWSQKELGLSSILFVSHDVREVAYMADRIVVLGMHPATVYEVIKNDLPRPRDYHSPEFLKLVERLHDTYGRIEAPVIGQKPRKKKAGFIVSVSIDQILGLLGYLQTSRGSSDVFTIGIETHQHFDKVDAVLQAAEQLDFVGVTHRMAALTPKGKEFIEGDRDARRRIGKEQLMTIPIFIKVCDLLNKAPDQSLHRDELIGLLHHELPHQDPIAQLNTLIRWGQYCNLFVYHRIAKRLALAK